MQADEIQQLLPPLSSLRLLTQSTVARSNTWTDAGEREASAFHGRCTLVRGQLPLPAATHRLCNQESKLRRSVMCAVAEFHKFFSGKFDLRLDSEPLP